VYYAEQLNRNDLFELSPLSVALFSLDRCTILYCFLVCFSLQ